MDNKNYVTRMTIDILRKNDAARDDMMLTVQYIHDMEMALFGIKKADYYDALFNEKVSSIKTIDRIWRRVQEEYPDLRGYNWESRQIQSGLLPKEFTDRWGTQLSFFQ